MDVSIIICTRNRSAHLQETLRSIGLLAVPSGLDAEVIVVDNGSSDNTVEMTAAFPLSNLALRLVREPLPGLSRARNAGIAASEAGTILFTDDDLRFPADWLEAMYGPIQSGAADAVAGAVILAPHLERPWMEPIHRYWLAATEPDVPGSKPLMVGANMAFRRAVLQKVPCFDTDLGPGALGFADDTLFSRQIWAAGYKIIALGTAVVEHHFEPERLSRVSLLDAARKRGETKAYVTHHWEHRRVLAPAARMLQKRLEVTLWRRRHPQAAAAAEGLPTGELYNLEAFHFYRHYLRERLHPHFYAKNGLMKRPCLQEHSIFPDK